jgi:hypothetical protein
MQVRRSRQAFFGGAGERFHSDMSAGSVDDQRKAQHWRWMAAEARLMAGTMSDPAQKIIMVSIAEAYVRLAERAELRGARQLIDTTAFGPDALKVIGAAFEAAWAEIAGNFSGVQAEGEAARLRLATALLSVSSEDSRDVEVLKRAELQRMALNYRDL